MIGVERDAAGKVVVTGVAPAAAAELETIAGTDGSLNARSVLDTARDPRSALHGFFTWDDSVAAEERRLDQARALIRRVKVVIVEDEGSGEAKRMTVRRYASQRDLDAETEPEPATGPEEAEEPDTGTYVPIDQMVGTTFERALIESIRRDIRQLTRKYENTELLLRVLREELPALV